MCMRLRKDCKSDTQRTSPEGMFRFISSDGNGPPSGTARGAGIFFHFRSSLKSTRADQSETVGA